MLRNEIGELMFFCSFSAVLSAVWLVVVVVVRRLALVELRRGTLRALAGVAITTLSTLDRVARAGPRPLAGVGGLAAGLAGRRRARAENRPCRPSGGSASWAGLTAGRGCHPPARRRCATDVEPEPFRPLTEPLWLCELLCPVPFSFDAEELVVALLD